jgi:uncharacterized protein (TIGR00251 family)
MPGPLTETADGVRLLLRVTPKAGRNEIAGVRDGRLLVKVTSAPEDGKANAAVIKLLSKAWRVPASAFEITSGATARDKTLTIRDVTAEQIRL